MFEHSGASKMRDMALAAAVGAGVLLGGAGFAQAEVESFVLSLSTDQGPTTQAMTFNQFDPMLGTLTGVMISYSFSEVGAFASAEASISGGEFGATATASSTGVMRLLRSGVELMTGTSQTATAMCSTPGSLPDDCNDLNDQANFNQAMDPNPLELTLQADIDPFIGPGTVNLTAELTALFTSNYQSNGSSGTPTFLHSASWSGFVEVTYTYTEATATPEPASLALFGLGLGALGLARRR
jgi:hypothetical protein